MGFNQQFIGVAIKAGKGQLRRSEFQRKNSQQRNKLSFMDGDFYVFA